jgi:Bacterial RNA polymerase, alpha chain C terminal domain
VTNNPELRRRPYHAIVPLMKIKHPNIRRLLTVKQMRNLRDRGATLKAIGEKAGICKGRVWQILRIEHGVRACKAICDAGITDDTQLTMLIGLGISVRVYNGLRNSGASTFGDAKILSDRKLLSVGNFGKKSLAEWKSARDKIIASSP